MNKKFLSVVLFGALMVGSSVTFTGCIDNDEPAGITDLRSAKAALIRANEAYRLVEAEWMKVQVELEQVNVEKAKVQLELKKLKLQQEQAKTDYEVAYYQNKQDSVAEAFKGHLLQLQTTTAENGLALEKALAELAAAKVYVTDSVFSNKLTMITDDLKTARQNIEETMGEIINLNNNLIKFSSDSIGVAKEFIAADIKSGESKLANDSVNLAEFQKLAEGYSNDAVNAQILDIDKQVIAIDKKVAELKQSINAVDADRAPIQQAISRQKATLEADNQSVTFAVPSAIQDAFISSFIYSGNDLANRLGGTLVAETKQDLQGDFYFVSDPVVKDVRLGTVALDNTVAKSSKLSDKLSKLAADVKAQGVSSYVKAYNNVKSAYNMGSLSSDATSPSNPELTETDLAKGSAALAQVEKDLTTAKTTYEADVKAFEAAVKAYNTAAEAYGVGLQLKSNLYKGVEDAFNTYNPLYSNYQNDVAGLTTLQSDLKAAQAALKVITDDKGNHTAKELEDAQAAVTKAQKALDDEKAKIDTKALDAARTALVTALKAYYPARKAMDGAEFKVTDAQATTLDINSKKGFVISDKLASLKNEEFDKIASLLNWNMYGNDWGQTTIDMSTTDNDGAAQTWIKATYKVYGLQGTGSQNIYGASLNRLVSSTEKVAIPLSDINAANISFVAPTTASAVNYKTLSEAKDAFSTIDSWKTLTASIEVLATASATKEDPIVAEIDKQNVALMAINEPLRDTIYEICKLDANQFGQNPVSAVATELGITIMNQKGEKQALASLKTYLQATINGTLTIAYTYYTYSNGILSTNSGSINTTGTAGNNTIKQAVTNVETSIKALKEYIADKNDDLASFDNESVEIAAKTKAEYEAALANAQELLKGYQAAFNALSKAKDELIAAMAD